MLFVCVVALAKSSARSSSSSSSRRRRRSTDELRKRTSISLAIVDKSTHDPRQTRGVHTTSGVDEACVNKVRDIGSSPNEALLLQVVMHSRHLVGCYSIPSSCSLDRLEGL